MKTAFKAFLAAVMISTFAMSQVIFHLSEWKFGPNISGGGSDSYGFLYTIWINSQPADGKWRTQDLDLLSRAPSGVPLTQHVQIATGLANFLSKAGLSPVLAYNLVIWLCFFIASFLAFFTFKLLGITDGMASLGAFIAGLCPYQILQAVDHVDLAATGAIWLDILFLALFILKNDLRVIPLLLLLTGISIFTHPYYFICLSLLNAGPFLYFGIGSLRGRFRFSSKQWAQLAVCTGLSAASVIYWKKLFLIPSGGIESLKRDLIDLYIYSTKFWDFVLPPHFSYLFEDLTMKKKYEVTSLSGSNFVENTLYPGSAVLAVLSIFTIQLLAGIKKYRHVLAANRNLTCFFAWLIGVPILFSLSPTLDFLDFKISTPTALLHEVLPQFRTLSRFGYISTLGMILLFILLLDRQFKKFNIKPPFNTFLQLLIGLFCVFDFGYFHQRFYSDTTAVPSVYNYLKTSTSENEVLLELPVSWGYTSLFWQSFHHRKHFGLFDPADPVLPEVLAATSKMDLPQLLQYCRQKGVDKIVLHTSTELNLPGSIKFENHPDPTWIFFLVARFSYIIPVPKS